LTINIYQIVHLVVCKRTIRYKSYKRRVFVCGRFVLEEVAISEGTLAYTWTVIYGNMLLCLVCQQWCLPSWANSPERFAHLVYRSCTRPFLGQSCKLSALSNAQGW